MVGSFLGLRSRSLGKCFRPKKLYLDRSTRHRGCFCSPPTSGCRSFGFCFLTAARTMHHAIDDFSTADPYPHLQLPWERPLSNSEQPGLSFALPNRSAKHSHHRQPQRRNVKVTPRFPPGAGVSGRRLATMTTAKVGGGGGGGGGGAMRRLQR